MKEELPSSFGVYICLCNRDYPFANACLMSVRDHLGDVPVCFLIDGTINHPRPWEKLGVQVIRRLDIRNEVLKTRSFGYGLTKMICFWEGPFERFLYLDADTVLAGNILELIDIEKKDLWFNEPHEVITPDIQRTQYFDPERLFQHVTPFPWKDKPFCNTGVLVSRKGLFRLEDYLQLLDLKNQNNSLMPTGEQGLLNYLIFSGAHRGDFTVSHAPLQTVVPVWKEEDLQSRFGPDEETFAHYKGPPTVVHWAGVKPWETGPQVYRIPMRYYRKAYARYNGGLPAFMGQSWLIAQEKVMQTKDAGKKMKRQLRKRIKG